MTINHGMKGSGRNSDLLSSHSGAGKGSRRRPYDVKAYAANYDDIDWHRRPDFIFPIIYKRKETEANE